MRPDTTKTDASVTDENIEPISTDDLIVDISDNKPGYLPHMLTNTSTKGLLPDYPSWALTRLGAYSYYNPNTGWSGFSHIIYGQGVIVSLFLQGKIMSIVA